MSEPEMSVFEDDMLLPLEKERWDWWCWKRAVVCVDKNLGRLVAALTMEEAAAENDRLVVVETERRKQEKDVVDRANNMMIMNSRWYERRQQYSQLKFMQ